MPLAGYSGVVSYRRTQCPLLAIKKDFDCQLEVVRRSARFDGISTSRSIAYEEWPNSEQPFGCPRLLTFFLRRLHEACRQRLKDGLRKAASCQSWAIRWLEIAFGSGIAPQEKFSLA